MAQRIIINFPDGEDTAVLVDVVPQVDEYVLVAGVTWQVCKVLHVVTSAVVRRAKQPVIYVNSPREPSSSERRYALGDS